MAGNGVGRWIAILASLVVVATIVAAIVVMGPPSTQRSSRLDERRVTDLGNLVQAIQAYREAHDRLPADLPVLAAEPGSRLAIVDPDTAQPYGYAVLGAREYQLCARFDTDTAATMEPPVAWVPGDWNHGVGTRCFKRSVVVPAK
jgi:type II secretory pathway pseudopilin PulG